MYETRRVQAETNRGETVLGNETFDTTELGPTRTRQMFPSNKIRRVTLLKDERKIWQMILTVGKHVDKHPTTFFRLFITIIFF